MLIKMFQKNEDAIDMKKLKSLEKDSTQLQSNFFWIFREKFLTKIIDSFLCFKN